MTRIIRSNQATPRFNKQREAHRQLWASSNSLAKAPAVFDEDKTYRVRLTRAVTPTGHSFPLRPMQEVLVSGKIAEEIKQFISGAASVV